MSNDTLVRRNFESAGIDFAKVVSRVRLTISDRVEEGGEYDLAKVRKGAINQALFWLRCVSSFDCSDDEFDAIDSAIEEKSAEDFYNPD